MMVTAMNKKIRFHSNRGQGVFLVLYALRALAGGCAKREVIDFIQRADYYEITRHDLPPYEDQNEPRYHMLLAWARKDASINEWLADNGERDAWQLSRKGGSTLEKTEAKYGCGELKVRENYLWTAKFKKVVDPLYTPSELDRVRPVEGYTDL